MGSIPHLAAFKHKDYRFAWASNALGGASTWTFLIASQWYVLAESDSSGLVGLFTFASMLPFLLASPIGGIFSDRMERKRLTAITTGGTLAVIIVAATLAIADILQLWHLCILAFISGSFRATQETSLVSLVANIVPKKDLLNAITLNAATRHGSRVIGMSILLLTRLPVTEGFSTAQFFCASALFGLGSLAAILLVSTRSVGEEAPTTGLITGMRDGLKFIYTNRPVGIFIVLVAFHCALVMSFDSILPVFSRDTLGSNDESLLALLVLSFGSGSVVGTFLISGIGSEKRKGFVLIATGLISAISPIGLGFSTTLGPAFIFKFLMGASQSTFMALTMTFVQLFTPDHVRGRVSSLYILHAGGIMAFANLGYGNLADLFGVSQILIITGVIFLSAFIALVSTDPVLKDVYKGKNIALSAV
ncbi:MAG: MFS transporter [Chloroflexota bacterium]|nr:MFS transporter [Chloroflexota bacterium]